jgi:long-chain acyl-CoA synthetase
MQEYTSPGEVPIGPDENLTRSLFEAARTTPDRPALAKRVGDRFVEWSARQFRDEVAAVAKGLIALGLQPGQAFCIHSATRIEWTILDYAIWAAGGITVPIYETSSSEQIEWIVTDSGAIGIATENAELKDIFDQVADKLPKCEHVFVLEDGGLEQIKEAGAAISDEDVEERAAAVKAADIATIVYTSGTTGRPKG